MSTYSNRPDPVWNKDLTLEHLPSENCSDWSEIIRFAQTYYNAEMNVPGAVLCTDIAKHREECTTLTELRNCLFIEYRRHNHFGTPPDAKKMEYVHELLGRICELIKLKQFD